MRAGKNGKDQTYQLLYNKIEAFHQNNNNNHTRTPLTKLLVTYTRKIKTIVLHIDICVLCFSCIYCIPDRVCRNLYFHSRFHLGYPTKINMKQIINYKKNKLNPDHIDTNTGPAHGTHRFKQLILIFRSYVEKNCQYLPHKDERCLEFFSWIAAYHDFIKWVDFGNFRKPSLS